MNEAWTVYASNTKTGNRLEFNGIGMIRIVSKGNVAYEFNAYFADKAVDYFNKLEGNVK